MKVFPIKVYIINWKLVELEPKYKHDYVRGLYLIRNDYLDKESWTWTGNWPLQGKKVIGAGTPKLDSLTVW